MRDAVNALQDRREHLIEEIYIAFDGVDRVGGVSWSEADVLDAYGSMEERMDARNGDKDRSWKELVDDKVWYPRCSYGGFVFLDPIGFRYYLAPAMIRVALGFGHDLTLDFNLTIDSESSREHISLLDIRQKECVRDFILYMKASCVQAEDWVWAKVWNDAFESYWCEIPDEVPASWKVKAHKGAPKPTKSDRHRKAASVMASEHDLDPGSG